MRPRWSTALLVALGLLSADRARGDAEGLRARAVTLEERFLARHSPNGLTHDLYDQGDGSVLLTGTSDCAIWTGIYTAGAAARFALYGDSAARLALERAVHGLHLLLEVTGEPGLYSRCAWRRSDPVLYNATHPELHETILGEETYVWRGDVSQDQISGVIFGLQLAFEVTDDPELRALIAADLSALAWHVVDNEMRIIDVDGRVTEHGFLRPTGVTVGGMSADGFAAVMGLAIIKAGAALSNDVELDRFYRETLLVERDYRSMVAESLLVEIPDALKLIESGLECDTNYNNYNMMYLALTSLIRLEQDPELLELYRAAMRDSLWVDGGEPPELGGFPLPGDPNHREVRNQENPFWTYLYYGCALVTPEPEVLAAAERSLEYFWVIPAGPVSHDNSADYPPQCLNRFEEPMHKERVIPIELRAPESFVWKRNPYNVVWSTDNKAFAGVDFMAPYWLGRYFGLLDYPDRDADGLADDREAARGTDPDVVDTDGDGISDGDEVDLHGTDPLTAPAADAGVVPDGSGAQDAGAEAGVARDAHGDIGASVDRLADAMAGDDLESHMDAGESDRLDSTAPAHDAGSDGTPIDGDDRPDSGTTPTVAAAGCGCTSVGPAPATLLWLLPMLLARRRWRSVRQSDHRDCGAATCR